MELSQKNENDWKKELTPEAYRVLRERGTEAPFSGTYVDNHEKGVYRCKACGATLFGSDTKFDSGTGWPSFTDPAIAANVGTRMDEDGRHPESTSKSLSRSAPNGFGARTEVYCKNCDGHLGHVFDDGPADRGGKRYCINSVCLAFEKER